MLISTECRNCLLKQNLNKYPADSDSNKIALYQTELRKLIDNSSGLSTPQVAEQIHSLYFNTFGCIEDYSEIKRCTLF